MSRTQIVPEGKARIRPHPDKRSVQSAREGNWDGSRSDKRERYRDIDSVSDMVDLVLEAKAGKL